MARSRAHATQIEMGAKFESRLTHTHTTANRVATLPLFKNLAPQTQLSIENALARVALLNLSPWSQQMKVAEGDLDACIWFCGDT